MGEDKGGYFERTSSKHIYYLGWNRSPAQAGCMRQALGPGALGRPRGTGWKRRWEGGLGWTHINPWLIHDNVWQKPLQYCKVISLQLIKKMKKKKRICAWLHVFLLHWNHIYTDLTPCLFGTVSQSYLPGYSPINALSWAAVLILPQMKLNLQLSCCAFFWSLQH